jgi:hypothetical protein
MADDLPIGEHRRKEIFRAIVDAQDRKMAVDESRTLAMQRFGVGESQIRLIEREGMDGNWPPL